MEADLAPMIEDEGPEASMEELLCPICLDLLYRPHSLQLEELHLREERNS